jgi:hypothetical protein
MNGNGTFQLPQHGVVCRQESPCPLEDNLKCSDPNKSCTLESVVSHDVQRGRKRKAGSPFECNDFPECFDESSSDENSIHIITQNSKNCTGGILSMRVNKSSIPRSRISVFRTVMLQDLEMSSHQPEFPGFHYTIQLTMTSLFQVPR